ncbi:hypothetical protein ACFE04_004106 [Oxalis oulophora]
MNPPSPNLVLEDEQEVNQQRREKPQWLDAFLAQTCRYCMLSGIHGDHHTIKIYRHVYQNVVCLMTMSQYLDCDQIQTIAFDNKKNKNIPPFLSHVANGIEEEENGEMKEQEQVMAYGEQQVFIVNHKEVVNAELALVERESEPEPIVVIVEDDQVRKRKRKQDNPTRAPFY